ncbi:cubilin-like isoform X1 [Haliotis rufescens]|uniref:cubilin-like isoform X1 n=2 Tax=Haliotis rufescens TaxID=6454 RepID=UPI00201EBDAA|nr:cubilin-like isoform X1 [Haliotis rufescens]
MIISCFIGVCVLLFGPLVSSACNVTLYAQGEPLNFTSPNYPGNYMSNDNCYWDIYPQTRGYNVILDMVFSDIEGSSGSNCPYDALTIYVKNNGDQRIGESKRICGQSRLNLFTREDQHIHAMFETDGSVTRGGFLIKYYETDGHSCGLSDLSASSVAWTNLTSPGYPSNYSKNPNCQWTISAPVGYEIKVEVVYFNVEYSTACSSDYLLFSDGSTSFAAQLGKYCGRSNITRVVVSSRNYMTITFHTDGSDTALGFNLKYKAGYRTTTSTTTTTTTEITNGLNCGSPLLRASTFTWRHLSSPGYPNHNYRNNMDCRWTVSAPAGYKIKVEIIVLSVEFEATCAFDYLLFSDGSSSFATRLGKYCYGTRNVVSSSNAMTITFHTDGSRTDRGFSLKYMARTSGSLLSASTSTWSILSSPGYPNYNNNMDCKWTISAPAGYKIKAEIIALSLEYEATCARDYLLFSDGSSSYDTKLGKYCTGTRDVVSSSNAMTITFHTDGSVTGRGFSLKYMARTSVSGCGTDEEINEYETKYIVSPDYPLQYPSNANCSWTISTRLEGYVIHVEVVDFFLEPHSLCSYDYVQLYDVTGTYERSLGRWCGSNGPDTQSTGMSMKVRFLSDSSNTFKGFKLAFTAGEPTSSRCGTDEEINEYETKYIESPNYPLQYPSNANCSWTISSRLEGYVIHVEVVDFYLARDGPCSYDYVQLYDVTGTYERSLGRWCGLDGPDTQSTGMSMKVRFHSDSSSTFKGFKLAFTAVEPASSSSVSPNLGGIIGGVFGGIVGVAIVTCCCCGICSRKKSTTNDQSQGNRSREVYLNTIYTVPVSNYPPTTATTLPAMFTPPPAYSEVVKDDPPPYCQAVPLSDILPVVTSSSNGASSYQGIDNPAGPS